MTVISGVTDLLFFLTIASLALVFAAGPPFWISSWLLAWTARWKAAEALEATSQKVMLSSIFAFLVFVLLLTTVLMVGSCSAS